MATKKLTEKPIVDTVNNDAYVFGVQNDSDDIPTIYRMSVEKVGGNRVLYTPQTLEKPAKKQACENIDALSIDGFSSEAGVGYAEQLLSSLKVEDRNPYTFRTSGGTKSIGNRVNIEYIEGGSIIRNQLLNKDAYQNSTDFANGVKFTNNGDGSITINVAEGGATSTVNYNLYTVRGTMPQIVLYGKMSAPTDKILLISSYSGINLTNKMLRNTDTLTGHWRPVIRVLSGCPSGTYTVTPQIFNLSKMLGKATAEALAQLPEAKALDQLNKFFPDGMYWAYDENGSIESVNLVGKRVTGFNQYKDDGYARVTSGQTYYVNGSFTALRFSKTISSEETDVVLSNNMFTPEFDGFVKATGTSSDFCINLSWSGKRNGEFESYVEHYYSMPTGELIGVPIISGDELLFDGNRLYPDGLVEERYEKRDYRTGDENLDNAVTNGIMTIVKKETTTISSGTSFEEFQIVDDWGTEEFILSNDSVIPVGHCSHYGIDMVSKLENLPNNAPSDGYYAVRQEGSQQSLVLIPNQLPSTAELDPSINYRLGYINGEIAWIEEVNQ